MKKQKQMVDVKLSLWNAIKLRIAGIKKEDVGVKNECCMAKDKKE